MSRSRIAVSCAGLLAASYLFSAPASAQSATGVRGGTTPSAAANTSSAAGNGIYIDKKAPDAAAAASALAAKAAARAVIRVMVGLNVGMRAPHELSAAQAGAQEQALRGVQNSVVERVLGTAAGGASVSTFDYIPYVAMNVTAAQVSRLMADPSVVSIQEDVPVPPTLVESVPFINADDVWSAGFPGSGIAVAILDTGVDKTHDMFPGRKIASEACYSTTVSGQSTSVCPGGVQASTSPGSGVNCPTSVSGCTHGTHVAGIAAGNMTSTNPDVRGVARSSRIIAIQVFSRFNSPSSCGTTPAPCVLSYGSDQIKGLERVYALRDTFTIASANMSLGGGQFPTPCNTASQKAIIDLLRGVRIATVIASGNNGFNGSMSSPACISSAIAVGSTLDTANSISSFSNHAAQVRHMAPGSNIRSSVPPGPQTTSIFNGTSMATPHVAGAYALLRDVRAGSTVDDIAAALECTGVSVTRNGITERRIDVDAARNYLLNPPNTTQTFTFNASAPGWVPFVGTWSINAASPGTYRPSSSTTGWKLSTVANCNENVAISSRLRRIWSSDLTANAGIAFKAQLSTVSSSVKLFHGYFAAISRDLPGNDHTLNVVLYRMDGVNLVDNTGSFTLLCAADLDSITSGTFYDLGVVSFGGLHRVTVNGTQRCLAVDYTYGTGRAGLMTFIASTSGSSFQADTFTIDPNETVPPSGPSGEVAAAR